MKNLHTTALALALTLSVSTLSACGGQTNPGQSADASTPAASTSAPAVSTPDVSTPDVSIPETPAPEVSTPETPAPDTPAPETPAPEVSVPETPAPDTSASTSVDLNAFVTELANQYGENFAANANVVEFGMHNDLYPGISDIDTKQLAIYQPMMGAVVCEIALAEVSSSSDVDAVKAIFQARIDAQVNGGAWYPESIEGWENHSRIVTNGNYVMMIAWSFCDEAVSAFNDLF